MTEHRLIRLKIEIGRQQEHLPSGQKNACIECRAGIRAGLEIEEQRLMGATKALLPRLGRISEN
ncbi:hypothetical protein B4096_0506 [Heyndrickxia coagulans]|uniref:Uncharacterized protein n=1 Tax=Heyndrickxia coagulans TaxID=1398 RepID=A0AAN0WDB2_HEYCO|nr:hypothetical protein SB48_HM08orf05144 [Heyndrickxia coagulans]KYC81860.1 hypothetical protein B4096_0506 [Heyndrickxia coagulans]